MSEQQQNIEINANEVKGKLQHILTVLNEENQAAKEFYHKKISELYEEISLKDTIIEGLQIKLNLQQKRYAGLQLKLDQKQSVINQLNLRLKSIQRQFKERIKTYVQQLNMNFMDSIDQEIEHEIEQCLPKRINISKYYIKATDSIKISTKLEAESNGSSTYSTLRTGECLTPKLSKVRSLDEQKFKLNARTQFKQQLKYPWGIVLNQQQLSNSNVRKRRTLNTNSPMTLFETVPERGWKKIPVFQKQLFPI